MATRKDVPPMLPMARSETALIDFARDVLRIMAGTELAQSADGARLHAIADAAVTRKLATKVEAGPVWGPWLQLASVDGAPTPPPRRRGDDEAAHFRCES